MEAPRTTYKKLGTLSARSALTFVVLLGVTSLFSDVTYEGARSLSGQFLKILGASATVVGITAGAGEFLGYALRLVSGYIADRTGRYWLVAFLGYAVNLFAVPCLALAGRWEVAAALLFAERIGKAIRNPSRDAMLSHATAQMGRGKGFGLHEALDQLGAFLGPLFMAGVLFLKTGARDDLSTYRTAFGLLLISALAALAVLTTARFLFPRPRDLESKTPVVETKGFSRSYWWYLGGAGLVAMGFADFPLMAYHFKKLALAPDQWIPAFYALAMAVDGVAALALGSLFDRKGLPVLVVSFAAAAFFAPFAFWGSPALALVGLALWGVGMGAQESIMRAAIAEMVPSERRASAYGLFHTGFGVCWFLGSAIMGLLYDRSIACLVAFSVLVQIVALPLFLKAGRSARR